jgi:hypothetical protein
MCYARPDGTSTVLFDLDLRLLDPFPRPRTHPAALPVGIVSARVARRGEQIDRAWRRPRRHPPPTPDADLASRLS